MSTPFAVFGPGILIAQRTDITTPAPVNVGYVQEFSIELAGNTKMLYGQKQFPLVAARSTIKATGKFKNATVSGLALNALFYGESAFSTGSIAWNIDSTYTSSTTSTQLQVGSSATFEADLGVKYSTSGLPLQRVTTGSEATGKYSITAGSPGLYNFAAGDQGVALKITYTNIGAAGQSLIVTNKNIGTTPTFQLDYYTTLSQPTAKPFIVRLFCAIAAKNTMQFKLEDFMIPEFDYELFANASDQIFELYFPEVS